MPEGYVGIGGTGYVRLLGSVHILFRALVAEKRTAGLDLHKDYVLPVLCYYINFQMTQTPVFFDNLIAF